MTKPEKGRVKRTGKAESKKFTTQVKYYDEWSIINKSEGNNKIKQIEEDITRPKEEMGMITCTGKDRRQEIYNAS